MLTWRAAGPADVPLLAELNHQLIADEGARNAMDIQQLAARMRGWLATEHRAVLFEEAGRVVAYALYRDSDADCYLRQFFVCRDCRRRGIGRAAMRILFADVFPKHKRLTVEVLTGNAPAVAFWRAVGYRDYSLKLEIMPERR